MLRASGSGIIRFGRLVLTERALAEERKMPDSGDGLTLEGLAQILRDHMTGTAAQFAEERTERRAQDAQLRSGIEELRREIGLVATLIRDLGQIVARHDDQIDEQRRQAEEHRQYIRQIYARMEQHDARFEAMSRDIRRILDTMERRGGNGGRREP